MKKLFTFLLICSGSSLFAQYVGIDTSNHTPRFKNQRLPRYSPYRYSTPLKDKSIEYAELDNMPIKVVRGTIPNMALDTIATMPNPLYTPRKKYANKSIEK